MAALVIPPVKRPARHPHRQPIILPLQLDKSCVLCLLPLRDNKWHDYSGHGNHATIYGATWVSKGRRGPALLFDGVDDYGTIPYSSVFEIQDEMTFEFWLYPQAQTQNYSRIIEMGGWAKGGWSIQQGKIGQRKIVFFFGSDTSWSGDFAPTIFYPADDQWYHVVATVKLGEIGKSYLNGEPVGSLTPPTYYPTAGLDLTIGYPKLHGIIDTLRIYNRVLTADEIRALYELGQ